MVNELRLVDELGQVFQPSDYADKSKMSQVNDDVLQDMTIAAKRFGKLGKLAEAEMKNRIAKGTSFSHFRLVESERGTINNSNNNVKQELFEKWGWDAFDIKSPTQLKKKFGDAIQPDIDLNTVYKKSAPSLREV